LLPATTPASQAGILHGRNDGIVGFRWYEKANNRLLVANHPDDAAEIVRRVSDGAGLLADDGASIGNLVDRRRAAQLPDHGDHRRRHLGRRRAASPSFLATSVNYIRLVCW